MCLIIPSRNTKYCTTTYNVNPHNYDDLQTLQLVWGIWGKGGGVEGGEGGRRIGELQTQAETRYCVLSRLISESDLLVIPEKGDPFSLTIISIFLTTIHIQYIHVKYEYIVHIMYTVQFTVYII